MPPLNVPPRPGGDENEEVGWMGEVEEVDCGGGQLRKRGGRGRARREDERWKKGRGRRRRERDNGARTVVDVVVEEDMWGGADAR